MGLIIFLAFLMVFAIALAIFATISDRHAQQRDARRKPASRTGDRTHGSSEETTRAPRYYTTWSSRASSPGSN